MQIGTVINIHKLLCFPVIFGMIAYYSQWDNPTAWQYLIMHGVYGIFWVVKDVLFPDKNFQKHASAPELIALLVLLTGYWLAPWFICSSGTVDSIGRNMLALTLYIVGIFFHFVSDVQKYQHMKLKPGKLLDYGMWYYLRNPNYLGETLIYASFVLLPNSIWPAIHFILVFVAVFLPNMQKKDLSLSRYPEFAKWKARSWKLVPFLY